MFIVLVARQFIMHLFHVALDLLIVIFLAQRSLLVVTLPLLINVIGMVLVPHVLCSWRSHVLVVMSY